MNRILPALLLLVASLAPTPAPAQSQIPAQAGAEESPSAVHLGLGEAIRRALDANHGLAALKERTLADRRQANATFRERFGQLDAFYDYQRSNDDWIVRSISKQLLGSGFATLPFDRNQEHYGVRFRVPLYLGGELASEIDLARLEADRTAALLDGTRWQVRFNATSLYTAVQTLDAVGDALDELGASLDKTEQRLQLMVEVGKRPDVDRLKVVEQRQDVAAQRASVGADRAKAAAFLAALAAIDPMTPIDVDPLADDDLRLVLSESERVAALEQSSVVREARLAAEQSVAGVRKARSSFLPKVYADGDYIENDAPSLDAALETWQVSVGVAVPLFHGGARIERHVAAKHKRAAALEQLEQVRLQTQAALVEAIAGWRSAEVELGAAQARVAAGVEAARIEQIRYDAGAGTIEDLLRAQAREQEAKASLARARGGLRSAGERINSILEMEAVK